MIIQPVIVGDNVWMVKCRQNTNLEKKKKNNIFCDDAGGDNVLKSWENSAQNDLAADRIPVTFDSSRNIITFILGGT